MYLYLVRSADLVKIGISAKPLSRLDALLNDAPKLPLHLLACVRLVNAYAIEQALHKHYKTHRIVGEWFRLSSDQILDLIELYTLAHTDPKQFFTNSIFWSNSKAL